MRKFVQSLLFILPLLCALLPNTSAAQTGNQAVLPTQTKNVSKVTDPFAPVPPVAYCSVFKDTGSDVEMDRLLNI